MKNLISRSQKHLLWKDDVGDCFLILKHAEVFRHSEDTLTLWIWSKKYLLWLRKKGLIFNEWATGDGLYACDAKVENLTQIIAGGTFKRRPHVGGEWVKSMACKLGHDIIPYSTNLKDDSGSRNN